MLKSLLRKASRVPPAPRPRVPAGLRVYAVGDIHGCNDKFGALLDKMAADQAQAPELRPIIVLLGDLVDRGPDSAGVVERAMRLAESGPEVRLIAGNHEELLLNACKGDAKALRVFARHGGRETAISYGIAPDVYDRADFDELHQLLESHVPASHRDFLSRMEGVVEIGDYAFVHAGIRPGVPLAEQRTEDLRWIRERFLSHDGPFERFVVHGHTISEAVDDQPNRLGIDTGAYLGGPLTAVVLEGEERRFLSA